MCCICCIQAAVTGPANGRLCLDQVQILVKQMCVLGTPEICTLSSSLPSQTGWHLWPDMLFARSSTTRSQQGESVARTLLFIKPSKFL
jgi:hypothetical protein